MHKIDLVLRSGVYKRDNPQWSLKRNVLEWTGARAQGEGISRSDRHHEAHECMGKAANRALKDAQAEGPMNQQNIGRQSSEQEIRNIQSQQTSLNLISDNELGARNDPQQAAANRNSNLQLQILVNIGIRINAEGLESGDARRQGIIQGNQEAAAAGNTEELKNQGLKPEEVREEAKRSGGEDAKLAVSNEQ